MFRYCKSSVTWWINCLVSWLVWLFDLPINTCGDLMINCLSDSSSDPFTVHWLMWWCGDWLINGLSDWSSDPLTRLLNCSLIYPSMHSITHSFVCSSIDPQNDNSIHGSMFNPIPALPLSSCAANPPSPRNHAGGSYFPTTLPFCVAPTPCPWQGPALRRPEALAKHTR